MGQFSGEEPADPKGLSRGREAPESQRGGNEACRQDGRRGCDGDRGAVLNVTQVRVARVDAVDRACSALAAVACLTIDVAVALYVSSAVIRGTARAFANTHSRRYRGWRYYNA